MKQVRVGHGALVIKDGKALFGLRINKELGDGKWCLPGGHLEFGESIKESVIRETKEETGLDIIPKSIISISNDVMYEKHYITFGVLAEFVSGEVKVMEPHKCEKWEWHPIHNPPSPLFESTSKVLEQYKKGKPDLEFSDALFL